jgi:isoamylase
MFSYKMGSDDFAFDDTDNAAYCPLAAVVDDAFTWGHDSQLNIPWNKTVIYETHIRSLTMTHPEVPEHLRGTYAGMCFEPIINHLKDLGVTAVELMPVHYHIDERNLVDQGLCNFWGYNTLSFFAPDNRYAHTDNPLEAVSEFKTMVRILHSHGIEVILDVVYNHTAEGNHMGPTFSFKGIDNRAYYRGVEGDSRYYFDYTGCGNSLNVRHPRVLQLIMDSLRYWITEMHVDGFRFDLASTLARTFYEVDKLGAFFDIIHQDPVISKVKLIAEPWDLGDGGYQVGNFPVLWTEWNGRFRDNVRSFWNGKGVTLTELANRLAGSQDLYQDSGRAPYASINFVTAHDGFTLYDLCAYNDKHNDANREDNRDGANDNMSWNCGAEGETSSFEVNELRWRQRANLMATMFLSLGVPMISGGDELSFSKKGNNNTYCQDNELNYYDWDMQDEFKSEFLDFTKRLISFRKRFSVLQRRRFLSGNPVGISGSKDITWFNPSGAELSHDEWHSPSTQCIGYILEGSAINQVTERGKSVVGDTLLVLINAQFHDVKFSIPEHFTQKPWTLILTTSLRDKDKTGYRYEAGDEFDVQHHSLALFIISKRTYGSMVELTSSSEWLELH